MRIVAVGKRHCTLSTGEELLIRFEKLRTLCEQLMQEDAYVTVRTWITLENGVLVSELIEVHRVSSQPPADQKEPSDVF